MKAASTITPVLRTSLLPKQLNGVGAIQNIFPESTTWENETQENDALFEVEGGLGRQSSTQEESQAPACSHIPSELCMVLQLVLAIVKLSLQWESSEAWLCLVSESELQL